MKTSIRNKKGFTIVELVIVIAVIAILAAVLIPTFASLVEKANLSADEQAVHQMNTALKIYEAENGKPENIGQVQAALRSNGINANIEPVSDGYAFCWDKTENIMLLVGPEKSDYNENLYLMSSNGFGTEPTTPVTDATTLQNAITASTRQNPALINLSTDISVSSSINVSENNYAIIDLNGKTISSTCDQMFDVNKGTITFKNGTMAASKRAITNLNGEVFVSNITITSNAMNTDASNVTSAVHVEGLSVTTIVDSKILLNEDKYGFCLSTNSSKEENNGSVITIIDSELKTDVDGATAVFVTTYSNVTIDGCTIEGGKSGIYFRGCNAIVRNTTVKRTSELATDTKAPENVSKVVGGFYEGNRGKYGDIILGCGGDEMSDYAYTANYVFENVTAATNDVFVHIPTNGKVTVKGIEITKTYDTNTLYDKYHKTYTASQPNSN